MARVWQLLVRASGDTAGAQRALVGMGRTAQKQGRVLQSTGRVLTRGLTLPLLAMGALSVKAFADFDGAMTNSLSIMGDVTDKQRVEMVNAAREVGRTTLISGKQAAEAFYFLASAGMTAEQSIAALPQVAKFAQAGNFDMATATDLATDAQSALGLAADDAAENLENMTRVTDVVARASQLANASIEQFSTSLTNKAGASMKAFGMDVEEGAAVLAVFADGGTKGEKAGTMFTATLNGLTKAAAANMHGFENLGIEVFDAEGNIRNMADVTQDLTDAFGPMSDQQRQVAMSTLGLNKLTADGLNLLMGNAEQMREYEGALRNASGAVDDVAGKQMESFNAQMRLLWNNVLDAGIAIGEHLVPYITKLATWIGNAARVIQNMSDGQAKWAVRIGLVLAVLGPLIGMVGGAMVAFGTLAVALGTVTATTVAIVGGIMAAVVVGALLIANWEHVSRIVGPIWETVRVVISDVLSDLQATISTWVGWAQAFWGKFGGAITTLARAAWNTLHPLVSGVMRVMGSTIKTVLALIRGDWGKAWAGIRELAVNALRLLVAYVRAVPIGVAMRALWNHALRAAVEKLAELGAKVREGLAKIPEAIRSVAGSVSGAATQLGRDIVMGVVNGVRNAGGMLRDEMGRMATGALNAAKSSLRIGSPSKLFAEQVGVPIGEGIALGIRQSSRGAAEQAQRVADRLLAVAERTEKRAHKILAKAAQKRANALRSAANQIDNFLQGLDDRASLQDSLFNLTVATTGGEASGAQMRARMHDLQKQYAGYEAYLKKNATKLDVGTRVNVMDTMTGLLGSIRDLEEKLGLVPDVDAPGLASGGTVTRGGSVWVGERGKELLSLPAGARVTPLDHPSMGGSGLTVHVHASDGMSVDQLVDKTIARLGRAASRTVAV